MRKVLMCVLGLIFVLTFSAFAEKVYVSSTGVGSIFLRSEPSTDCSSNGTVSHGEEVSVSETKGEWSKVNVKGTTRVGWIKTKYINGMTEALGTGTRKVVADDKVPVYTDSNAQSKRKGYINPGAEIKILNTQGDFVRIQAVANNESGWIEFKYVEIKAGENFDNTPSADGSSGNGSDNSSGNGSSSGQNGQSSSYENGSGSSDSGSAKPAFVDPSDSNTYYVCHVSVASLSIRAEASKKSDELTTLSAESVVKVLDMSNSKWYKVQTTSGVIGYASADCLDNYATAQLSGANLNLRSGPSTSTDVVIAVKEGRPVVVDQICGEWAHVMVNGNKGYMLLDYLLFDGN